MLKKLKKNLRFRLLEIFRFLKPKKTIVINPLRQPCAIHAVRISRIVFVGKVSEGTRWSGRSTSA